MKFRVLPYLCAILLLFSSSSNADEKALPRGAHFVATGEWQVSGLAGYEADKSTVWTNKVGATAWWQPGFAGPVKARVALHKIVAPTGNDARVQIEVLHGGKHETQFLNFAEGATGWVTLGTFDFAGTADEGVKLTKISPTGNTRASAVRFELLGENGAPVQTVVIDDLMLPAVARPRAELVPLKNNYAGGPPAQGQWQVTFREEFEGDKLNTQVWQSDASAPGHILSSRWPENVVVKDGTLRLCTKRETRGGKSWTSGNIWTKVFKQQYGYFEARMKIGKASGLNNAFWLMTNKKKTDPYHFEIDITEAHYPDSSHMTLHNWSGEHWAKSKTAYVDGDLSVDFHVYAAQWDANEIIWYLDGQELYRLKHDICRDASPLRLSSAVAHFAGRIGPELDGTQQEVDWVRVYQRQDAK